MWSDDPIADYARHDAEQQRRLDELPHCAFCGEPIQDETCYVFDGDIFCNGCMNKHHRRWTADFRRGREENF